MTNQQRADIAKALAEIPKEMREIICKYYVRDDLPRLASDAGISTTLVNLTGSMINAAYGLVDEAVKQNRNASLMEVVLHDYPGMFSRRQTTDNAATSSTQPAPMPTLRLGWHPDDLSAIIKRALRAGLMSKCDTTRSWLLQDFPQGFVASMPVARTELAQTRSDLMRLRDARIEGYAHLEPLGIWLSRAAELLAARHAQGADWFKEASEVIRALMRADK